MLKFIGTGSAFNVDLGNTSAYIKEKNTLLIIDCGETAFTRMKQLNIFEGVENVYIAITHMHSDHVGSLGSLVSYLNIFCGIMPTLIISNGNSAEKQEDTLRNYLTICGIDEDEYDFSYADMMEDVLSGLIKIEMIETKHSKHLTCYAVELHFEDKTVYFTGDTVDLEYVENISKNLKENDIVYTDCTNKEYKNRIHISLKELCEIFNEEQRKNVTCMHFENFETICKAKELGFKTASRELSIEELLKHIVGRK